MKSLKAWYIVAVMLGLVIYSTTQALGMLDKYGSVVWALMPLGLVALADILSGGWKWWPWEERQTYKGILIAVFAFSVVWVLMGENFAEMPTRALKVFGLFCYMVILLGGAFVGSLLNDNGSNRSPLVQKGVISVLASIVTAAMLIFVLNTPEILDIYWSVAAMFGHYKELTDMPESAFILPNILGWLTILVWAPITALLFYNLEEKKS